MTDPNLVNTLMTRTRQGRLVVGTQSKYIAVHSLILSATPASMAANGVHESHLSLLGPLLLHIVI